MKELVVFEACWASLRHSSRSISDRQQMDPINNQRWIPVGEGRAGSKDHAFWEKALRLSDQRIGLIAANIANADTPNFKASTLDFKAALEHATMQVKPIGVSVTSHQHLTTRPEESADLFVRYRAGGQPSLDHNTVDLDVERAAFADATVRHQFALQRAIGEYKDKANWISSLK